MGIGQFPFLGEEAHFGNPDTKGNKKQEGAETAAFKALHCTSHEFPQQSTAIISVM